MIAAAANPGASRVVITGAGVVSAAGSSMEALTETLGRGRHCLSLVSAYDATGLTATHAGEVHDFDPLQRLPRARAVTLDRGTQFALEAARQALRQAALEAPGLSEAGVAIGTSGSPQYQNAQVPPDQRIPVSRRAALYTARSTPSFQADVVARTFGLSGPRFAFGSASLGGLLALSHAMDLLRSGHATAMLAGGGEIQTLVNALGMDGLGLTAVGACTPFAGSGGICFGEGAAFFVLELLGNAERRGAQVLAEVLQAGISADAYGPVGQDPSGRGLTRAINKCFERNAIDAATIGWIRASGTGARELDQAEAFALRAVSGLAHKPVTSTEPYFSHVNGVSPLLGLAAVVAAVNTNQSPGLPEPTAPRPGLDLALLGRGVLPEGDCLLTATAFGGTNGAVVVRKLREASSDAGGRFATVSPATTGTGIVIAGMGAVSGLGGSVEALLAGVGTPANLNVLPCASRTGPARLIDDAWLRPKLPGIQLQRRERLIRMAFIAVSEALADAGVSVHGSARYGLLVGSARGRIANHERFAEQTMQGRFDATTGRSLLNMGRFSIASEIAHAFGLLGYSGAMACGVHGGVEVLAHGAELLASSPDLDGLLVVAADEWTDLQAAFYHRLGLLGDGAAHSPTASGCFGGEGAAALLLCRREAGTGLDGDWATIDGTAFAGDVSVVPDPRAKRYQGAINAAISRSGCRPQNIDFAVGQACGWPEHDRREWVALKSACPDTPLTSVLPYTGVAESAGGLFSAIVAAAALRGGCLPALPDRGCSSPNGHRGFSIEAGLDFRRGMVIGSTERGSHAALVLSRIAA